MLDKSCTHLVSMSQWHWVKTDTLLYQHHFVHLWYPYINQKSLFPLECHNMKLKFFFELNINTIFNWRIKVAWAICDNQPDCSITRNWVRYYHFVRLIKIILLLIIHSITQMYINFREIIFPFITSYSILMGTQCR